MDYSSNERIVIISGSNGVGKTTVARKLLQNHPEFIVVQNIDILREVVRNTYNKFPKCNSNLQLLNKSASELTYKELLLQSELLIDPILSVCRRLHYKHIPAIIEGINICYEVLFNNYEFQQFIKCHKNIVFINLYLSNSQEHYERVANRIIDDSTKEKQLNKFDNIRSNNNLISNAVKVINNNPNNHLNQIINIDVIENGLSKQENIDRIVSIIESVF